MFFGCLCLVESLPVSTSFVEMFSVVLGFVAFVEVRCVVVGYLGLSVGWGMFLGVFVV